VSVDGAVMERFSTLEEAVEAVDYEVTRRGRHAAASALPGAAWRRSATRGTARLVCAERWEQVTPALEYLTRTLPAQPVTREQGEVLVQASAETLRAALRDDVRRATDRLAADAAPRPDPNHAEFESSARAWLQEAVGMLPLLLDDLGAAGVTVTLPDEGLRVSAEVDLARVSSPVARRWLDTLARPDARAELLARLPPGAMLYASGSATLEPLRATMNFAAMAASRSLVPVTRMLPTESTALRTAVSALFAQERAGGAAAVGVDDQGRYWNVSLLELSTPGMQFVANARQLVAACRRPLVARAIRADHQIDPLRWLLPVVPGLPRGAMLVRIPPGQFLWSGLVRDIAGDMSRQQMEVLLVPDGARGLVRGRARRGGAVPRGGGDPRRPGERELAPGGGRRRGRAAAHRRVAVLSGRRAVSPQPRGALAARARPRRHPPRRAPRPRPPGRRRARAGARRRAAQRAGHRRPGHEHPPGRTSLTAATRDGGLLPAEWGMVVGDALEPSADVRGGCVGLQQHPRDAPAEPPALHHL
jgi:hypothetical protein